jgi:hypothetical protein
MNTQYLCRLPIRRIFAITILNLLILFVLLTGNKILAQGTLTNGWTDTGTISPVGDSDSWTFSANAGDSIVVRVGEISTLSGTFSPRIRLNNPLGGQQAVASGATSAEIAVTATNSGTFTVIVDVASGTATGTYRLTLGKSPGAIFVAPGDEGGPMTNGVDYVNNDLPVGDLDVWTFTANTGDSCVIKMGRMTNTGNFEQWIRVYGPNGALIDSAFSLNSSEVSFRATNSGTFSVLIANNPYYSDAASGTYRLTLAKTGDPFVTSPTDEGGPMTNGATYQGDLPPGDVDMWSFSAVAGDSFNVKMGRITATNNFEQWIRVYGPNGALIDSTFSLNSSEVSLRATNSGTFLVIVENNPYFSDAAAGTYRLTFAKTGEPFVTSPGDEGGPMTNGANYQGDLPPGDMDMWNFSATAGDSFNIKMGRITATNNFEQHIRVYGPNGALIGDIFSLNSSEISLRATNTGTFLVIVDNDPYYSDAAAGTYRLTLAKTGDPFVTSPGDEGGPMINGVTYQGGLAPGDMDMWNFSATAGDSFIVRMGRITGTNNFEQWIRIYGPDGALIGNTFSLNASEVSLRATNSGTFLVIVDNNPYYSDAGGGTYRLKLAKTGDPIVVSPGDEGGPMTNGVAHTGSLPIGDLDLWNFTATAGQSIVVRLGEITDTNLFDPWVRLYGPDGALLGSDFGFSVGEVTLRATNSGTFLVVVANNPYNSDAGNGTYILTLAKTGGSLVTSPGDEGGSFSGSGTYNGTITLGDLDAFTFTACSGEWIYLRADELSQTNLFDPWIRLYGPTGILIASSFGATSAEVSKVATNTGSYLVVIANSDYNSNLGSGTYALTVNGLTDSLRLCAPVISGTNANVSGVGGTPGTTFILFTHTNLADSFVQWTPILTNQFDTFGVFTKSNSFSRAELARFFRLLLP